eukprot:scaffold43399_cov42-Phaeocystis_antarctica.AAC.1
MWLPCRRWWAGWWEGVGVRGREAHGADECWPRRSRDLGGPPATPASSRPGRACESWRSHSVCGPVLRARRTMRAFLGAEW